MRCNLRAGIGQRGRHVSRDRDQIEDRLAPLNIKLTQSDFLIVKDGRSASNQVAGSHMHASQRPAATNNWRTPARNRGPPRSGHLRVLGGAQTSTRTYNAVMGKLITAADIAQYLDVRDDFDLELFAYQELRQHGWDAHHGGTYMDPFTEKPRQYDVSARKEF